ncbi:hypothetical protein BGZ95_002863, partial [Linnemannia exigua]
MPIITQNNLLAHSTPPNSSSSGHSKLTTDGGCNLSQIEQTATLSLISHTSDTVSSIPQGLAAMQLGPANLLNPLGHHVVGYSANKSDAVSVSSGKSSRFGFRKRLSALIKGDRKVKNTAAYAPPPRAPARTGHCVHSAVDDVEALVVPVTPVPAPQSVDTSTITVAVPTVQVQPESVTLALLLQDTFPKNFNPVPRRTPLPKPHARIEETTQLVHCCQLLSIGQPSSPASDPDELEVTPLDEAQQGWVQLIDPMEQEHLCWIIEKLVRAFIEDNFKDSTAVAEI